MNYVCLDGNLLNDQAPVFMADNKSYRYGDGLFETMKVIDRKIFLADYHFNRLFQSLEIMRFKVPSLFTSQKLQQKILSLCEKNNCETLARIRLSVFRGNGGISENLEDLQYLIECWPLNNSFNAINENGLLIDICPDVNKSCDKFANIKSGNFLPYVMAAIYAKENRLNDSLILNVHGRIADSSIANVFIVKGNKILTPSLTEGCINGVVRKLLLDHFCQSSSDMHIEETFLTVDDLLSSDEVFLTNAISGIRWVKQFRAKSYSNSVAARIYNEQIRPFF